MNRTRPAHEADGLQDLSIALDVTAQQLLLHAARISGGTVGAGHLWHALPHVSEREWLRIVGTNGLPTLEPSAELAFSRLDGVRLDPSSDTALEMAEHLSQHFDTGQVTVGHIAVALAGIRPSGGGLAGMRAAAEAYFDAELEGLEDVVKAFSGKRDESLASAGKRASRWRPSTWKRRRAWKRLLMQFLTAVNNGWHNAALHMADELLRTADASAAPAHKVVLACSMAAETASVGVADWAAAHRWTALGLEAATDVDEPQRALLRALLIAQQATAHFQTGDLDAAEDRLRASQDALTTCEGHPSSNHPLVRRQLADLTIDLRLQIAGLSASTGRFDVALRKTAEATGIADNLGIRYKAAAALTYAAYLYVLLDDLEHADALLQHLEKDFDLSRDLQGLSRPASAQVLVQMGTVTAAVNQAFGYSDEATSVLVQTLEALQTSPQFAVRVGLLISVQARLVEQYLSAGQTDRAMSTLNGLEPRTLLQQHSHDEVLAATVHLLQVTGKDEQALEALQTFEQFHGRNAVSPHLIVNLFPDAAQTAWHVGQQTEALAYIERATMAMAKLSGGQLPTWRRMALLDSRRQARDTCLEVTAAAASSNTHGAGRLALQVADTWRETTLSALLSQDIGQLPEQVRQLVNDVQRITALLGRNSSAVPVGLTSPAAVATGREKLTVRLDELRGELATALGTTFAELLIPQRAMPMLDVGQPGEALLSVTPVGYTSVKRLTICTAWMLPDGTSGAQEHVLGARATRIVSQLSAKLRLDQPTEIDWWHQDWKRSADDLAAALLPDALRQWLTATPRPTLRYVLDGALANVPVIALPIGDGRLVADAVAVNRVPFLRTARPPVQAPTGTPRVLAYVDEPGQATERTRREQKTLENLAAAGRLELTLARSLENVVPLLREGSYDVLALSCHGEGSGLGFHFHDDNKRHLLHTSDLLGVTIPPLVVAASCFSGSEGATDIAGVVATLLARGARTVVSGSWAIPDESSADVLRAFYERLGAPGSVSEHLRAATTAAAVPRHEVLRWSGLVCTAL